MKKIILKAKYRSFEPGRVIQTAQDIMEWLVLEGKAVWHDEQTEEVEEIISQNEEQ
jgi:hypothetical protein